MRVDKMLLLFKGLIACLSIYIMGDEECYEDLFVYNVYRVLNIVRFKDRQNDRKIYTIQDSFDRAGKKVAFINSD
jgi:hypothetical protein